MEGDEQEACNIGLSLELRLGAYDHVSKDQEKPHGANSGNLDLSFDFDFDDDDDEGRGLSLMKRNEEESPDYHNSNDSRKKLRLTKDQSFRLENSFRMNNSINAVQKQALAEELNLKPRQIEVWFQNRRARTKVKQTEVDCHLLKKCHEKLTKENQRLKKELEMLKVGSPPSPPPLSMTAATHSFCPSCRKLFIPKIEAQ